MSKEQTTLESIEVQVSESSAHVTRRGTVALCRGSKEFRVPIATTAIKRTLAAQTSGDSTVTSARVDYAFVDLTAELEALRNALRKAQHDVETARLTAENLTAIHAQSYEEVAEDVARGLQDDWSDTLVVARTKKREAFEDLENKERTLADAEAALAEKQQSGGRLEAFAVVNIASESDEETTLTLRYQAAGAAWRPLHTVRLEGKTATFECAAALWQNTGEDWKNAEISVATRREEAGVEPPNLGQDRLRVQAEQARAIVTWEDEVESGAPPVHELPAVSDGGQKWAMTALKATSISSDGQLHLATLFEFQSDFSEGLVVMGDQSHFRATFENGSGRTLLAGPARLYREGDAIGTSRIPLTQHGRSFDISLGAEDALSIKFDEDEQHDGSGRKAKTKYMQRWKLKNVGRDPISFELLARIPVSTIEEVTVVHLEESTSGAAPDQDGRLSWLIKLEPGQSSEVLNAYGVVFD